ncbi:hypothetical protein [Lentzea sp. HUAS12]|uniref:hypothetical protein n=1 Tax=Lentzea sp. HUAS12 TaxID=2951806 RepID=UPI00209F63C9|nr:hypothetical protein [Lentzea sp. HUAS12]USX51234.1 hypothetical protein ND450_38695 [Lentzea sp. HUAS12]
MTAQPGLTADRLSVLAEALSVPDGGFTVDPVTGADVSGGYAVSIHPEREQVFDRPVTGDDLAAYVGAAARVLARQGRVLGGWHDPESGRVHLDVSVVVPDLANAFSLGRCAGQLAVYDFASGKSVPIPDDGGAQIIPLRKSLVISSESRPEEAIDDVAWRYHQKGGRRKDRTYSGHVTYVGGAEGERIRRDLAAAIKDLLVWINERENRDGREAA